MYNPYYRMTYNQQPYQFSSLSCYQQCRRNGFSHEFCVHACRRPQYVYPVTPYSPTIMSTAMPYESSPGTCEFLRDAIENLNRQISELQSQWHYATSQEAKDVIYRQIDELQGKLANVEYEYSWVGCTSG